MLRNTTEFSASKKIKLKIGILGGGQLARMIMEECYKFGHEFHILSNERESPAGQLTKFECIGNWNNKECLSSFSKNCDIITLENEFIDYQSLEFLENYGKEVLPSSSIIKMIQDKLIQKKTLHKFGIPSAEFTEVNSANDIEDFTGKYGYPVVLKSRTMGYDGKGNYTIKSGDDIEPALKLLSERGKLMCEKYVNFDTEIATQVVRSKSGEVRVYPVVETIQKNHICNLVIASEKKFGSINSHIKAIAEKIVNELNYTGVMGIEMFLKGDEILVNELAPRVHNSGHYTIEGCRTSQFENHIRAILDLPLGSTGMTTPCSVMINILGSKNHKACLKGAEKILKMENVFLHIYGKKETREGRKMGHITVNDKDMKNAIDTAKRCREEIEI